MRRRRSVYLVIMGCCVSLIALAWIVVWRYSLAAALVMSGVASVLPPFAAVVANPPGRAPTPPADRRQPAHSPAPPDHSPDGHGPAR